MSESDNKPKTNALFAWQDTKSGLIVIVLFDLFVSYGFASLALDTGSLLQWFGALLFLALAVAQGVKLAKKVGRRG